MINSPIQLNEEQKEKYLQKKMMRFRELLATAENETGMGMTAILDITPHGIIPRAVIVPKEVKQKEIRFSSLL